MLEICEQEGDDHPEIPVHLFGWLLTGFFMDLEAGNEFFDKTMLAYFGVFLVQKLRKDMARRVMEWGAYIENDDEVSLSFGIRDPSIFSRVMVDESGVVERVTWQKDQHKWVKFWSNPRDDGCDSYRHCGSFSICDPYNLGEFECQCLPGYEPKVESEWYLRDATNGCKRKPGEQTCRNSSSDVGFIRMASVKVPDTTNAIGNRSMGLEECADLCLKNCSCTAYANSNVENGGSGCITWYGDLIDMRQFSTGGQDVYIRVSASELAQYLKYLKRSHRKRLIIVLVPSVSGLLLLVFAILVVSWKRKGKRHKIRGLISFNLDRESTNGVTPRTEEIDENGELAVFDLKSIISATNCFDFADKLGEGGFGSVYKGQLQNGREIAIKRLSKSSGQGVEEFKNEAALIARLQHRNLVKLLGCCIQQEEKMLVYEYLPNKGLDNFIFHKEKGVLLDWKKRLHIIIGIARGIVYLHRDSRLRIIHRDLKASNVLLDANMEPKISDFGMARIFNADQMEAKTQRVMGTYGYMAPEYAMQGLFSEKSDVFSYGVLLLEIITGRRNNSYFSDNAVSLIGYVWELWQEGNALEIIDPAMGDDEALNHVEVGRCIQIGLFCVQERAMDRPTMSQVLSMLCHETSIPSTSPKQPAYVIKKLNYNKENSPYQSTPSSGTFMDDFSITVIQGR
ncbi:OLC1v1021818C1 [Oldenlandia corymbosa var. corymbosa]|uniref:non-specific serine/threonine protein kinase n=1 Tax=Oldenlandia corymbosa var. corymbosa TaxID=529605 RepID=A0AAV1BX39_OLDCO|nr:OLC1v1021818C1 [Oldenlandia corymbosa var. corymbosa]